MTTALGCRGLPTARNMKVDQILKVQKLEEKEEGRLDGWFIPGVTLYLFKIIDFVFMLFARLVCVDVSVNQPMETNVPLGIFASLDVFIFPP